MRHGHWAAVAMLVIGLCGQGVTMGMPFVDQEQWTFGGKTWAGSSSTTGPYKSAQQVEPTMQYLFQVDLVHSWNEDISAGDLNLRVLGTYATWAPDHPDVVELGSKTINYPAIVPQPHTHPFLATFDFSDNPIDLTGYIHSQGDTNMYIYLEVTGDITDGPGTYKIGAGPAAQGGLYPRPFYQMTNGTTWVSANQDMTFRTYGSDVPEPTTLGLVGIGGGVAMIRRRRRA